MPEILQHSDLSATYSGICDWLDVRAAYRHIHEERGGEWKYENRPHLGAAVKFNLGGLSCSNRGRLSYRNREDADNSWFFRNKLSFKFPLKITKLAIQPYLADEAFYDFDACQMNRNRLYAAIALKLLDSLKAELYYLWQSKEGTSKWSDTHVPGTKPGPSF